MGNHVWKNLILRSQIFRSEPTTAEINRDHACQEKEPGMGLGNGDGGPDLPGLGGEAVGSQKQQKNDSGERRK